jgi:hypothetical protein
MPDSAGYTAGWIDSTVHDFLLDVDQPTASMKHALVTCLDSCFDLPLLARKSAAVGRLASHGEMLGKSLRVTTKRLLAAEQSERIFFGFDEVWFFAKPPVRAKPDDVTLVGPEKLAGELPRNLVVWLDDNHCTLGLGDGTGLNLVARIRGIAKYIVHQCVESAQTEVR